MFPIHIWARAAVWHHLVQGDEVTIAQRGRLFLLTRSHNIWNIHYYGFCLQSHKSSSIHWSKEHRINQWSIDNNNHHEENYINDKKLPQRTFLCTCLNIYRSIIFRTGTTVYMCGNSISVQYSSTVSLWHVKNFVLFCVYGQVSDTHTHTHTGSGRTSCSVSCSSINRQTVRWSIRRRNNRSSVGNNHQ